MSEIRGELVALRPWRSSDAPFLFDMYSKWDVQRFIGRRPAVMSDLSQAEALLHRLMAVDDPIRGYWAVETIALGELTGTVMVQRIRHSGETEPSDELEIGWHFHPDAWGHGYATSAARLAARHAFDSGANRLVAVVHPENEASARVCQRLGMTDEGITDRYYDGSYRVFVLDGGQLRLTPEGLPAER